MEKMGEKESDDFLTLLKNELEMSSSSEDEDEERTKKQKGKEEEKRSDNTSSGSSAREAKDVSDAAESEPPKKKQRIGPEGNESETRRIGSDDSKITAAPAPPSAVSLFREALDLLDGGSESREGEQKSSRDTAEDEARTGTIDESGAAEEVAEKSEEKAEAAKDSETEKAKEDGAEASKSAEKKEEPDWNQLKMQCVMLGSILKGYYCSCLLFQGAGVELFAGAAESLRDVPTIGLTEISHT